MCEGKCEKLECALNCLLHSVDLSFKKNLYIFLESPLCIITGSLTSSAQATIFYSDFCKACLRMCESEGTGKPQPCLRRRAADQTF